MKHPWKTHEKPWKTQDNPDKSIDKPWQTHGISWGFLFPKEPDPVSWGEIHGHREARPGLGVRMFEMDLRSKHME